MCFATESGHLFGSVWFTSVNSGAHLVPIYHQADIFCHLLVNGPVRKSNVTLLEKCMLRVIDVSVRHPKTSFKTHSGFVQTE